MNFHRVTNRFCLVFFCLTVVLCAWITLFSSEALAESFDTIQPGFDQQVIQRAQAYLLSIQQQTSDWSTEEREKAFRQAQMVIGKGLQKLRRPSQRIPLQTWEPVDQAIFSEKLQKVDRRNGSLSKTKAIAFVRLKFRQPSDWEVTARLALPQQGVEHRSSGVLSAYRPISGSIFDFFGFTALDACEMILAPTTARDAQTWARTLGQTLCSSASTPNHGIKYLFFNDTPILSGFPLIAQTVILQI